MEIRHCCEVSTCTLDQLLGGHDTPEKTIADQLEALARAEFIDLQPAEVKLIRAATSTRAAHCGPSDDVRDPFNNPEFSESGSSEKGIRPWGADREVRVEVLRWLCVNRVSKSLVDPRGIQLFGGRVTGDLDLRHADVPFPLSMVRCRLKGTLFLNACEIERLELDGSWVGPINADGANVKQSVYLRGVRVDGTISLNLVRIGGTLTCEEGKVLGGDGVAIWADGIKVGGDVLLRADSQFAGVNCPFQAKGTVRLIGAEVHGDLDCSGGEFLNSGGDALVLERAAIHGQIFLGGGFKVEGTVSLSNATATAIEDDPACWPTVGNLRLDGFSYKSFEPKEATVRLTWLALDSSDAIQPYRQLAKVYQDSGDARNAKRVLIAMEKKLSSRDRLRCLKALIGYGYQPGHVVWWLVGLWVVGASLCWFSYSVGTIVPTDKDAYSNFELRHEPPLYYARFQPFVFSLENTAPLVKLGQADKWQPNPTPKPGLQVDAPFRFIAWIGSTTFVRWFIWIQIVLGWLFTTLFVAAVSGIVQHE